MVDTIFRNDDGVISVEYTAPNENVYLFSVYLSDYNSESEAQIAALNMAKNASGEHNEQ
ncbi:hypothetical protein [Pluralibacter gergoviae]|uniref:hypothetical protein n=1 Tax=Pluralibacter gergoviae TaxID=61647 RepID=UPI000AFE9079|nr:hypothetical protein [Pluralibacter gergoviae]